MARSLNPASGPQPTEKQLKQTLKNTRYLHPSAAAKQIQGSLDTLRDLKPSVKEYTFKDGKKSDLMQLSCIIPVKAMGESKKTYNVPVRVWLPRAFPKERPFVCINPSPELALSSVNYVDSEGLVDFPYLTDWKESRSNIATLINMMKYKFGQQCPVYHIRVGSCPFALPRASIRTTSSSSISSRKSDSTILSNFSMPVNTAIIDNDGDSNKTSEVKKELEETNSDIESKDKEIVSYKKTIATLTEELDELRSRVRDLEQAKHESLLVPQQEMGSCTCGIVDDKHEETVKELEEVREEKERYKELLETKTEKLQKEITEKEKIKSRLDSKISDLTQTREKNGILEVENQDLKHKLQKKMRELKRSKAEFHELLDIEHSLQAEISALKAKLHEAGKGSDSELEEEEEAASEDLILSDLEMKLKISKQKLEEATAKVETLEAEKVDLRNTSIAQASEFSILEKNLIEEKEQVEKRLNVALRLCAAMEDQDRDREISVHYEVQTDHIDGHIDTSSPQVVATTCDQCTQVKQASTTDSEVKVEQANTEVQVEILSERLCEEYRRKLQDKEEEVSDLNEKLSQNNSAHKEELKEAESKILQLLSIKEQLTNKNEQLSKQVKQTQLSDYGGTLNDALRNIQELEANLNGGVHPKADSTNEQLKKEIEELKKAHSNEREETRKKINDIIAKVKEREMIIVSENEKLKTKLERSQKLMQDRANSLDAASSGVSKAVRVPESNIVSFMEVDLAAVKFQEGKWGYSIEGVFRGKKVTAKYISKESLVRFSIDEIHKHITSVANLHHPNIVLFIAVAMDAPVGMMILTELQRCTLKQAYMIGLLRSEKLPVMLDVALALNFLHLQSKPIVHDNLSSNTVVVEEAGNGKWRAKLLDIGVSTPSMVTSGPDERPPVYLAPENRELGLAKEFLPPSSDVYSYGILLSEVALNSLPDPTSDISDSIGGLKETLPQVFCLIRACLSSNPEQRPAIGTMVTKIQNLVANNILVP